MLPLLIASVLFLNTVQAAETKPWSEKMKGLYSALTELLLDVSSEERFKSKANEKRIEQNAKKLADLAHDISQTDAPDPDPSIPMISSLFDDDAKRAYNAFKTGHKTYSRTILRTVSGYCIACHTRNQSGPKFDELPTTPAFKKLSKLEKANFYSATRQFDRALGEYQSLVENGKFAQEKAFEWENSIRNALAISVRVRKNPDETLKVIDKALQVKNAPEFILENARAWKKSALEWKNEGARKPMTDEGYSAEAIRLITAARASQKFPADHHGDIYYLRATEVLHDQLRLFPESRSYGEAMLMLGMAYEAMGDLNMWSLHEMYFESCIRKVPHTEAAAGCYKHYEKAIYLGYTGSSGTNLPKEELQKLSELKALATVKNTIN